MRFRFCTAVASALLCILLAPAPPATAQPGLALPVGNAVHPGGLPTYPIPGGFFLPNGMFAAAMWHDGPPANRIYFSHAGPQADYFVDLPAAVTNWGWSVAAWGPAVWGELVCQLANNQIAVINPTLGGFAGFAGFSYNNGLAAFTAAPVINGGVGGQYKVLLFGVGGAGQSVLGGVQGAWGGAIIGAALTVPPAAPVPAEPPTAPGSREDGGTVASQTIQNINTTLVVPEPAPGVSPGVLAAMAAALLGIGAIFIRHRRPAQA